jgi:metal-dependent amidase/aminoacylase/carboxypeptidase family protein
MNVRSSNLEDTLVLKKRVLNCFEGAAKATGCTVEFSEFVSRCATISTE